MVEETSSEVSMKGRKNKPQVEIGGPIMKEVRRPVAVTVSEGSFIVVVCDDGTVWMSDGEGSWEQPDQPIPGTQAAED